jgi:flagellin-like hook-associated protein FlgL
MGYLGLNSSRIHGIDQSMLINSLDAKVAQSVSQTYNSGFVQQSVDDDYSFSNVIAAKNLVYQYNTYSNLSDTLNDHLSDYEDAQDSFTTIQDNVAEIKSLITSARNGTLTGTGLDNAQDRINTLVTGIMGLVDASKVDNKKIFDGTFTQSIEKDISTSTTTTMSIDLQSLNIDTRVTSPGSLGAGSSTALNNLTVSSIRPALGGATGTATSTTLDDINAIQANLTRMRASLDSTVGSVSKVTDRINDKMTVLEGQKENVDLSLGGYFNATNVNVQIANRRKALNLLP